MFPKLDAKKMQTMMKQLGIKQEDIQAKRVIIEKEDENIIINNPSVIRINMQGQDSFQISGDVSEESSEKQEDSTEEDIKTIMEKTGKSEKEARQAIENSKGDLAEAILLLS